MTKKEIICESCVVAGEKVPATTRSVHPDYSGYDLCDECAGEYDKRWYSLHNSDNQNQTNQT